MWHDRIVYYRDFAYDSRRLRMASGSIGDVPAATFAELLSGPMIDIYVGGARRHWSLHRNLLCHHSESLEAELEGDDNGNKRKDTLELVGYDPVGFELLVKWLYQGKMDDVSELPDANQKYEYAVSCHKLYLLCDRLDMPQLKNVAMDQYRKGLNEAELVPDAEEIDDIYRQSPTKSPFRQLMTRIAARQIMDPGSERDVDTYRQCFENNPDFAVDLVKAIRLNTGGMLFQDPTDPGNPCQYHDHEDGPNCHIKGKRNIKQARKTPTQPSDPSSNNSAPSTSSGPQSPLHPQLPLKTPRQHTLGQARHHDGISVGPLRRRLTSPASSTVGTSSDMATASLPPNQDTTKHREKWRKVTPPERKKLSPEQNKIPEDEEMPSQHQAQERRLPSSGGASRLLPERDGQAREHNFSADDEKADEKVPSRRGIWEWARAGTGRLNIIGRIPHPEWKGPPITNSQGLILMTGNGEAVSEAHDDFSIPSTTATEPRDAAQNEVIAAAKAEDLGIGQVANMSPSFSQTKMSSDDLVATASSTGTPESRILRNEVANGDPSSPSSTSKDSPPSTPDTPTPHQRKRTPSNNQERSVAGGQEGATGPHMQDQGRSNPSLRKTPPSESKVEQKTVHLSNTSAKKNKNVQDGSAEPYQVPTYKIALAPNLFTGPA